jgi:DNA-nicking Smr family endonuclease
MNNKTIDLHGLTVNEAFERVRNVITTAKHSGLREITIITGKSGVIRKEFPHWVARGEDVREVKELHGGGSFLVKFKKTRVDTV